MKTLPSAKPDITSRAAIQQLIDTFYTQVRKDELLGFIFEKVASTDWNHHLPRMYDFWDSLLFQKNIFRGNPLAIHAALAERTPMGREQFQRWLTLFFSTVDAHFEGPNATRIKNSAADMAAVIHRKINHLPDTLENIKPMTPSSV